MTIPARPPVIVHVAATAPPAALEAKPGYGQF